MAGGSSESNLNWRVLALLGYLEKQMIESGSWQLHSWHNQKLIIEVLPHVAFAYIWSREHGIHSHVWLFNCSESGSGNFGSIAKNEPPTMPTKNIAYEYEVPNSIDDISFDFDPGKVQWSLFWSGKLRAIISTAEKVGRSVQVNTNNDLANALDQIQLNSSV